MSSGLREFWITRSPLARAVFTAAAAVLGLVLYAWLVHSAQIARNRLGVSVEKLRAESAQLERHAAEYVRLRATPAVTASSTSLLELVQAQAVATGVAHGLQRIDAPEANRVEAVLAAVAFANWHEWVIALQAQQVRLETCRIEATSATGMVGVSATFTRNPQQ